MNIIDFLMVAGVGFWPWGLRLGRPRSSGGSGTPETYYLTDDSGNVLTDDAGNQLTWL